MALAPSAAADGIFLVPGSRQADPGGLRLEALTQPEQVRPGGMFRVVIVAILEPGWHIYSIEHSTDLQTDPTLPTQIVLQPHSFPEKGPWRESPPHLVLDRYLGGMVKVHSGRAEFYRPFAVPPGKAPGAYPLQGSLTFRACDQKVCTLPRRVSFQTRVEVASAN